MAKNVLGTLRAGSTYFTITIIILTTKAVPFYCTYSQLRIRAYQEQLRIRACPERLRIRACPERLRIRACPKQLRIRACPERLRITACPEQLRKKDLEITK